MNGEVLSQMEYDQVCAAIYHEACGRNRGEGDSEVSQRLGKEVLAGDETTGYLWEEDKKLYWTDADGNTSEIGESGWDTSGFVRAGTHEEFYGAYSIPPEKREPLAALIESSDDFEGKQALIEAIRAGHLDASQHFLVMERLDIMANNGMATDTFESVDDLLAVWDSSN
jgi:hypothetical protein